MAKCAYCSEDMSKVNSCIGAEVKIGGKIYFRETYEDSDRCHDCNVGEGGIHHFGCDNEHCPKCKDQFAFCECEKDIYKTKITKRELLKQMMEVPYLPQEEFLKMIVSYCDNILKSEYKNDVTAPVMQLRKIKDDIQRRLKLVKFN